jgi:hypothetical protein
MELGFRASSRVADEYILHNRSALLIGKNRQKQEKQGSESTFQAARRECRAPRGDCCGVSDAKTGVRVHFSGSAQGVPRPPGRLLWRE